MTLTSISDGYRNLVANLGTDRDKAAHGEYVSQVYGYAELLDAYRSAWLPRKIVDIPSFDSIRRWRSWTASKDQITALEQEESRLGLRKKVQEAMRLARLYGGGAIFISTDEEDTSKPLDLEREARSGVRFLTVIPRQLLIADLQQTNVLSERYGRPETYRVSAGGTQQLIHHSRLIKFSGAEVPWGDVQVRDDWGDSVLAAVFDAIKRADSAAANIGSLIFEAKVDVIHIPKLMKLISTPEGERSVQEYLRLAMRNKSNNGALVLDGGDTSQPEQNSGGTRYETKSQSFGGLDSIFDRFMQVVSGAADIPATRLLGQSPAGLNSSGESDLRNYYDHVQSIQELEIGPEMATFDELLVRSVTGQPMGEVFYTWRSLWQPTDEERLAQGQVTMGIIKEMAAVNLWPEEVLSRAGANAMIETGAVPGLEAAINEYGELPPAEDEPDMERPAPALRVVGDANLYRDDAGRFASKAGGHMVRALREAGTLKEAGPEHETFVDQLVYGQPAKIAIRPSNLEAILEGGILPTSKTGVEPHNVDSETRAKIEHEVFGTSRADRPVYGYLGEDGDDNMSRYGTVIATLKPSVLERSTVTFGDSIDANRALVAGGRSLDEVAAQGGLTIPAAYSDRRAVLQAAANSREVGPADSRRIEAFKSKSTLYVEAQVWSGVKPDEIASLKFVRGWPSPSVKEKLARLGITYEAPDENP